MAISAYSSTPASNTAISGINIAEGCLPSGINDAIRQLMADIASQGLARFQTRATDLPSAATLNLDGSVGEYVNVTGTTGITAITLADGKWYATKFSTALTITNGASLICPGGVNYTTAAGDVLIWAGEASGVVRCIGGIKGNGQPLVSSLDGVVIGSTTPAAGSFTSINGGQLAGTRNRVINGGVLIDQRNNGASQTILNGTAAYTVDRMFAFSTGANCTGQRVYYATNKALYRFTGAASVTAINFGQKIESLNIADLAGQTATLSVKLSNSGLTTVAWSAYYANALDNFGATTAIASGSFTVNSTLTKYSTQIALPAGAANGVVITLSVGAQTSGTWDITELQLESGSVATPFEMRSYGLEFMLAQRYYEVGTYIWRGFATSGTGFGGSQPFAIVKRIAPTMATATTSATSFPAVNSTVNGVNTQEFDISRTANATASGVFADTWTATAEL